MGLFGHFHLLTVGRTLAHADTLISLATTMPEHEQILSTCATIVVAGALEQCVKSCLKSLDMQNQLGLTDLSAADAATAGDIRGVSFRDALKQLPLLLSEGQWQLNERSPHVRALHRLIGVRNSVLHSRDEPVELTEADQDMVLKADKDGVTVHLPIPQDPWLSIDAACAEKYRHAAGLYFDQVLRRRTPAVPSCAILIPASG